MKNNHIALLVGAMTVALSGLILLQYNWIKDSIAIKEARFDQDVSSVLDKVATSLEKMEAATIIWNNISKLSKGAHAVKVEITEEQRMTDGEMEMIYKKLHRLTPDEKSNAYKTTQSVAAGTYKFAHKSRHQLGIETTPYFADDHSYVPEGLLVELVVSGSAAADAGLQKGDIILSLADEKQTCNVALGQQIGEFKAGSKIEITYRRNGNTKYAHAKLTDSNIITAEKEKNKPFLGVYLDESYTDQGLLINHVVAKSAAHESGLQKGDIIITVNAHSINELSDLRHVLTEHQVGEQVAIAFHRSGVEHKVSALLKPYAVTEALENDWHDAQTHYHLPNASNVDFLGELLKDSKLNKAYLGITMADADNDNNGVLISEVVIDGPADLAGLRAGDIITSINGEKIVSGKHLKQILQKYNAEDVINIGYKRKNSQVTDLASGSATKSDAKNPGRAITVQESVDTIALAKLARTEELIKEVAQEMILIEKPLQERIDPEMLDITLKESLADAGIKIPFEYCVRSKKGNVICGSDQLTQKPESDLYKKKLYEMGYNSHQGELSLHFPTQEKYILSSSWMMVGSSFFFNLIIILVFGYTIRTIIRQKKLSEMKTDFINNMTHELKTPISTINLACEMLTDQKLPKTDKSINRYAGIIKDENIRLQSHVDKVLQFARLDKSNLKLTREMLDMHELIKEAVNKSSLQVEQKNGSIGFDLQASAATVEGDKLHLSNVIFNILDNAVKYARTEVPPVIHVSTHSDENQLKISIKDNGIGMSRETVKRIFDKFYRVPTGNIHNVKGFGLGLSYAKLMVEAHGGEISAKSRPNKGSIFEFTLPLKAA